MPNVFAWQAVLYIDEKRDAVGNIVEPSRLLTEQPLLVLAKDEPRARLRVGDHIPPDVKENEDLYDRLVVAVNHF